MHFACRIVRLIATILLVSTTDGLSVNKKIFNRALDEIPTSWKLQNGRPRVCSVIERTLSVATRIALFQGGSLRVVVDADSNRDVFRGKLNKFSIAIRNSKSPLGILAVDGLTVDGSNLRLGWRPLFITAGVPLTLLLRPLRQTVWTLSIWSLQWILVKRIAKNIAASTNDSPTRATTNTSNSNSVTEKMEAAEASVGRRFRQIMGGSPSQLGFEMVLSNSNLRNSSFLRLTSSMLLKFLMKNSILQTAAVVGDAVNDSAPPPPKPIQNQLPAAGASSNNEPQRPSFLGNAEGNSSKLQFSKLLSATAFELREAPTFQPEDGKNHLQFSSVAILPDNQARLEFVLRTTLAVGNSQTELLRFVQPECRFDVTEATSSLPLPKIVSGLLPKELWLPIGSGVAIGGDKSLSIREIKIVPEGQCRIRGNLSLLQSPPSGGLVRR